MKLLYQLPYWFIIDIITMSNLSFRWKRANYLSISCVARLVSTLRLVMRYIIQALQFKLFAKLSKVLFPFFSYFILYQTLLWICMFDYVYHNFCGIINSIIHECKKNKNIFDHHNFSFFSPPHPFLPIKEEENYWLLALFICYHYIF